MRQVQKYRLKSGVEVTYRGFRPTDAKRCSEILLRNFEPLRERLGAKGYREIIEDVYSESNLPNVAQERDFHVVSIDDRIVGIAGFMPDSKTEGELANLSVDPEFHGKGIGKFLVALRFLGKIEEGITKFYGNFSEMSRTIYLKLGFTEQKKPQPEGIADGYLSLEMEVTDAFKAKVTDLLDSIIEKQVSSSFRLKHNA